LLQIDVINGDILLCQWNILLMTLKEKLFLNSYLGNEKQAIAKEVHVCMYNILNFDVDPTLL
jgi:hypothetical protein